MTKRIVLVYIGVCLMSFILASLILAADFGNEKVLYGALFKDYEMSVYKGIAILCVFLLPIFMNLYSYIRNNKALRLLSFFLWPILIYIFEISKSSPQELKNLSVVFFSIFCSLLLGYIYFQKSLKKS
ncbi:hypothetical protein [Elizabethkingia sp. JS20170427COW]|uniref:hypothetical protein n=1 Tax=Elizabethkingia sp. JS20170427COW TaxID=2583851 RepID=UPI0011108D82|nr:hypothetical protein [Elizabethkingia sp. JS20170427COW]QCX54094.1 hypothetical protein FGE20_10270 [Elizabethkingia sp. JS20170427COW]